MTPESDTPVPPADATPPLRAPVARRPDGAAVTTPAQRRERRLAVEALMLAGKRHREIHQELGAAFGVSLRTIQVDAEAVQEAWAAADARTRDERRSIVLRDLRRLAEKAENAGKFGDAVRALEAYAKIGGLALGEDARGAQQLRILIGIPALVGGKGPDGKPQVLRPAELPSLDVAFPLPEAAPTPSSEDEPADPSPPSSPATEPDSPPGDAS